MSSGIEGKNVLFLVKDKNNIKATSTFLERRELNTYVCDDLKEAIRIMDNTPPDFLCLSVNYPHPKVTHIPKLISSTFGVETIMLAEKNTKKAVQLLSQAKSRHVLFGDVSGPSMLMKIRRIVKDQEEEVEIKKASEKSSSASGASGTQVIKSSGPRKKESYHVQSSSDNQSATISGSKKKNKTMIFTKTEEEKAKEKGPGFYNPQENSEKGNKSNQPKIGGSLNSPFSTPSRKKDMNLDPFGESEEELDEAAENESNSTNETKNKTKNKNKKSSKKKNSQSANPFENSSAPEVEPETTEPEEEFEEEQDSPFSDLIDASGGLFALPPVATESKVDNNSSEDQIDLESDEAKESSKVPSENKNAKGNYQNQPQNNLANENGSSKAVNKGHGVFVGKKGEDKKPTVSDQESDFGQSGIGYMPDQKQSSKEKDSGYVDLDAELSGTSKTSKDNSSEFDIPNPDQGKPGKEKKNTPLSSFDPFASLEEKEKSSKENTNTNESTSDSRDKPTYKEHNQTAQAKSQDYRENSQTEYENNSEDEPKNDAGKSGQGVFVGKKGETVNPFAGEKSLKPKEDYLEESDFKSFKSSIDLAIEQICDVESRLKSSIETTEKMGFIPIDSGRYCGYLTVAIAETQELRGVLLQELGINIAENLFEMGENIEPDEAVILDISDPDLINWAKKKSQVLIESQHNGAEIIVSYIPKNQALPIIVEASTDMLTIDVIDIEPGKLLDFETYLHLPKNNKYIRYSRTGSTFSEKQIDKLSKKAKGRVTIKQDDNYNFKKNYIEKSVNEELEQFKKTAPAKKKKAS